jgi:hypothetical protein
MASQRVLGLAILVASCYFLAGGIFNQAWALTPFNVVSSGITRQIIRIIYAVLGIVTLLVGLTTLFGQAS